MRSRSCLSVYTKQLQVGRDPVVRRVRRVRGGGGRRARGRPAGRPALPQDGARPRRRAAPARGLRRVPRPRAVHGAAAAAVRARRQVERIYRRLPAMIQYCTVHAVIVIEDQTTLSLNFPTPLLQYEKEPSTLNWMARMTRGRPLFGRTVSAGRIAIDGWRRAPSALIRSFHAPYPAPHCIVRAVLTVWTSR